MRQNGTVDPRQYSRYAPVGMKDKDMIIFGQQETKLDADLVKPGFSVLKDPMDMRVSLEEGFPPRIDQKIDLNFGKRFPQRADSGSRPKAVAHACSADDQDFIH